MAFSVPLEFRNKLLNQAIDSEFSVPTDIINLCAKFGIQKSHHYGGEAM